MQVAHRGRQFAANGAANATRLQQYHVIVQTLDEKVVDTDFAQFVDDHRGIPERGIGKQTAQKSRLARSEKPGEQRHWREGRYVLNQGWHPSARAARARAARNIDHTAFRLPATD